LTLHSEKGQYIIETNESNQARGGVLIENIHGKEENFWYTYRYCKSDELNYPSRHKELLVVKKVSQHFMLYLSPVRFFIRTYFKIFLGMLKYE